METTRHVITVRYGDLVLLIGKRRKLLLKIADVIQNTLLQRTVSMRIHWEYTNETQRSELMRREESD